MSASVNVSRSQGPISKLIQVLKGLKAKQR
jgi:hypothetical protein